MDAVAQTKKIEEKQSTEKRFYGLTKLFFSIALLIHGIQWGMLFWKLPPTEDTIFLHYNIYFGIDLTGSWNQLLWLPGSGAAIIIMNVLFLFLFPALPRVLQNTVAGMTLCIQLILASALALIIYTNLS